ncbi:MAG TPA: RDD family protein [Pseudoxanthomonas sp.]|jgi:uncharacterized RDD family membrane protein YckC|nr:RDD family protein [Pseudoxanthomonas sp.]
MSWDLQQVQFQVDRPRLTAAAISRGYDANILLRRWAGTLIDFIVLLLLVAVPAMSLGSAGLEDGGFYLGLMLAALYFPVMETVLGKTVGKYATFTRVVNLQGDHPSPGQSIIRTLFRLIEVNPLFIGGVPAGLAVLFSQHKQRLGDMVANTFVITEGDFARLRAPLPPVATPPPLDMDAFR